MVENPASHICYFRFLFSTVVITIVTTVCSGTKRPGEAAGRAATVNVIYIMYTLAVLFLFYGFCLVI